MHKKFPTKWIISTLHKIPDRFFNGENSCTVSLLLLAVEEFQTAPRKRQNQLIYAAFSVGLTLRELGCLFGMSHEKASQMKRSAFADERFR